MSWGALASLVDSWWGVLQARGVASRGPASFPRDSTGALEGVHVAGEGFCGFSLFWAEEWGWGGQHAPGGACGLLMRDESPIFEVSSQIPMFA